MAENEVAVINSLNQDSIKVIAESIGVNYLPEFAAKELAEEVTFRLKILIQDSIKVMRHGKREKLACSDVDSALRMKNIEPLYGFYVPDYIPFRYASGGGRELHFIEEKELDLNEVVSATLPKLPLETTLRAHWLVIEGVQPTIPENPPPVSKDSQRLESVDPIKKLTQPNQDLAGKPTTGKFQKLKNVETVHVKQLATHELSVEQQLYYKEITEACVGSEEGRRVEALQSLACDPGLHEMLPRMCTFITEGVRVNVVQNNLALLIYLMRMVKALLDNQSLYLEKYLHELIPSVATCIVSKQLCMRPEMDNHWALRDFASRLLAQICNNFNTSTNNVQSRITRLFSRALEDPKAPLSSLYGSLQGLSELGSEVVKVIILPRLKVLGERIEACNDSSNIDKIAGDHIRQLIVKVVTPLLKTLRATPDVLNEYTEEFGYFGPTLHSAVMKARIAPAVSAAPVSSGFNAGVLRSAVPSVPSSPSVLRPPIAGASSNPRTLLMTPNQAQQKQYVLVSRPPPPSPGMKLVTSHGGQAQGQKKLVVVHGNSGGLSSPTLSQGGQSNKIFSINTQYMKIEEDDDV